MENKHVHLDHHLFNIPEMMFGSKESNLGTIKYVGETMLGLSDGKCYRCCGIFGENLALINDLGGKVCHKPVFEWTTGRKREKHFAHMELIEDYTIDKLLTQIFEEGIKFYLKSNKPPKGITFPIMIILINETNENISIFPDKATPEILEGHLEARNRLAKALLPLIEDHF